MADGLGRLTILVLAALAGPAIAGPTAAGPTMSSALEALDACLEKLNPEIDIGYERIAGRCPQLAHRLEEGGWSPWLPRDWKRHGNDLSAGGLRELREILSRESIPGSEAPQHAHRPSVATLSGVLGDLASANSAQMGWWARTKEWLRSVLERGEQDEDAGWLGHLVSQNGLSQTVLELTSYATLMLVALLAAIIVANELRVSGVLGRLKHGLVRRRAVSADFESKGGELTWNDVLARPMTLRPQLLLEAIVARLTAARYLPPARALTVRELMRAASLSDQADLERLSRLARISERVRFSSSQVSSEDIAAAIEDGRVLFERLAPTAVVGPEARGRA